MTRKMKDLLTIAVIYLVAFAAGWFFCGRYEDLILRFFAFDAVATVVVFAFSVVYHNSSVYDAYWSLTPMVMALWLFMRERAYAPLQLLFLLVFELWGARLTLNWVTVFTGFDYEDWRYRKYREETPKVFWPVVNFWGIHMMPTLVVFAGMLPLFRITRLTLNVAAVPGMLVMLTGIALEYYADHQMHDFLEKTTDKVTCRNGLWGHSRHPNYLGEITFWVGVFLTMLPFATEVWYYGIGCLSIALLFNVVSIPLMEKRQTARRADYGEYCKETSRLLLKRKT